MDAPPPYPGAGGWQPPPPYSETDPAYSQQQKINPYPQSQYPPPAGGPWSQGQMSAMVVLGGWDGDRALETVEMFDQRTGQWNNFPNMLGKSIMMMNYNLLMLHIQFLDGIMEQEYLESICMWLEDGTWTHTTPPQRGSILEQEHGHLDLLWPVQGVGQGLLSWESISIYYMNQNINQLLTRGVSVLCWRL